MAIDPRSLSGSLLAPFDAGLVNDDYDDDEPLILEATVILPGDLVHLVDVPFAVDNCVIKGCDLSLFGFRGAKNSLFVGSKLRATHFDNYVRNVVFDSCQLTECLFRMITMDTVTFEHSQLAGCDFYGSELTALAFPGSDFAGVGFDQCTIDGIDLTKATELAIGDPRTLKGASICETQVPLIATRLAELTGIDVRDC
jgi:uncharacterized protein YjbI with pentapeptide repeats